MNERKVFLSAGHSNTVGRDNGAIGIDGVKEGDLTVELRKLLVAEFKFLGVYPETDSDDTVTKETVAVINAKLGTRDIAIDIHFNAAANLNARGTEVLIPFKSSQFERDLAKSLCDYISGALGGLNRGVKTEAQSARGTLIFMRPNCENILLEICFITNKYDVDRYKEKKHVVAKSIAMAVFNYLTK